MAEKEKEKMVRLKSDVFKKVRLFQVENDLISLSAAINMLFEMAHGNITIKKSAKDKL